MLIEGAPAHPRAAHGDDHAGAAGASLETDGDRPLQVATIDGHVEVVVTLEHGANVDVDVQDC